MKRRLSVVEYDQHSVGLRAPVPVPASIVPKPGRIFEGR